MYLAKKFMTAKLKAILMVGPPDQADQKHILGRNLVPELVQVNVMTAISLTVLQWKALVEDCEKRQE